MRLLPRLILRYAVAVAFCASATVCDNRAVGPTIGPPAAVVIVGGQDQTGTVGRELAEAITVKIVDRQNRPVAAYPVNFDVASGGGTATPQRTVTSADGVATARWTLGPSSVGSQQLEVSVVDTLTHEKLVSVIYRSTGVADAPASLEKTTGDGQTATSGSAVSVTPSVKAIDQYGNPVAQRAVTWQASTGGTINASSSASSTTNEAGVAVAPGQWVLSQKVETNTLTATVAGVGPATFSAVGTAGAAAKLAFVVAPSAIATNGERLSSQPVVQLTDQYGNAVYVADAIVQITQVAGSGAGQLVIWNDTTKTNAQGVATFTGTTINGLVGDSYRLGFSTPTTSTLSSDAISLLRGQPYALALRIPADGASPGESFTVQRVLQIVDAGGNTTPAGECVNASINPGGGLMGGTQVTTLSDSYAFNTLGISSTTGPGTYTITYTTGCCAPNTNIRFASQSIEVP